MRSNSACASSLGCESGTRRTSGPPAVRERDENHRHEHQQTRAEEDVIDPVGEPQRTGSRVDTGRRGLPEDRGEQRHTQRRSELLRDVDQTRGRTRVFRGDVDNGGTAPWQPPPLTCLQINMVPSRCDLSIQQ